VRHILGITGSPGTGKKSIAPLVSERLGVACHALNDLADELGLVDESGEVDTDSLCRKLSSRYESKVLLFGHLLPYSLPKDEVIAVAVLRCDPRALKLRLEGRRYSAAKVKENVEAELIGLVAHDTRRAFGERAFEVDTTKFDASQSADAVLNGFSPLKRPSRRFDWTEAYDSPSKLRALAL